VVIPVRWSAWPLFVSDRSIVGGAADRDSVFGICGWAGGPLNSRSASGGTFAVGHQAIIYGRIQGARESAKGLTGCLHTHNAAPIQTLPDRDEQWPFLARHLFGLADHLLDWDADRGLYKSQVIHFGASFKDEPREEAHWKNWLIKFEGLLLKKLVWESAKVHCETDSRQERVYLYRARPESVRDLLVELEQCGSGMCNEIRLDRHQFDLKEWQENWLL
jgi:hypothetical protein